MLRYELPERRKAYRVYAPIPVICEITDPEGQGLRHKTVMASDINSGGIYFETDELFPLKAELKMSFQLPKSPHIINTKIKIARIEAIKEENNFGIAASFIDLNSKDEEEIVRLVERLNINRLLDLAIKKCASDLHLLANSPPVLRVRGDIEILNEPKLSPEDITHLLYSIMSKQQIKRFLEEKDIDFGVQFDMQNRFRINVHKQRGFTEATLRLISTKISSFEELNIPEVVKDLARLREGLIIIAGTTGSGKTTTIAAMIELINQERKAVIITLEKPIEYVFANKKSIIKQREVGIDTNSFSIALKSSLKQDPNVIVIGEIDDAETIRTAIIAAEAGHLVIASFHAPNTIQAIDRLTNMLQIENRKYILFQLSSCLKGIVSQVLIPSKNKERRVLATEILLTNEAVKRVIRNDELIHLPTIIQTGAAYKMQPMNDSIRRYLEQDLIDIETANFYSEEFNKYMR